MAVQKTIIKNDNMRAVVHLIGTEAGDSSTIALTELINSHQTSSATTALTVNIAYAQSNVASSVVVRRGNSTGTVVLYMFADSEFPGGQQIPALALNNTSSIHVSWTQPGMLILDLRKIAGYDSPNYNVGV